MAIYCGIDPGANGGIAFIGAVDVWAEDMPVVTTQVKRPGKKPANRNNVDASALALMLSTIEIDFVVLEKVPPLVMAGGQSKMGSATSFKLGQGFGICEGVLAGLRLPYSLVTPQAWKKKMLEGTAKDKSSALLVARRMFPTVPLPNKEYIGQAEALLMARVAQMMAGDAK